MHEYLSRQELRMVDDYAEKELGIPSVVLMENAGLNAANLLHADFPEVRSALIICGKGNNAGDGFVIGRQLVTKQVTADFLLLEPTHIFSRDASINYNAACRLGMKMHAADDVSGVDMSSYDLVIDAVYGIGFSGILPSGVADVLCRANEQARRRISIDLPSGLDADTGNYDKHTFVADETITMFAPKIAFRQPHVQGLTGRVRVAELGIPFSVLHSIRK